MIVLGHRYIESEKFYHVADIDAIAKTPPGATIFLEYAPENLDIIEYMRANAIPFALGVKDVYETIMAYNLGARFLVVERMSAQEIQAVAETYLFDAKVLARIEEDKHIETMAKSGIDGVVYPAAFVKVSS